VAKNSKKKNVQKAEELPSRPWISMRKGVIIIAVTSVVMAVLTAWQIIPSRGWVEGILWGLLFGAFIWAIFFGNILINTLFRK